MRFLLPELSNRLVYPKLSFSGLNPVFGVWLIMRLIILVLGVYFLSNEFTWVAIVLAIHLISTPFERIFFFLVISIVLGGSFILAKSLPSKLFQYLLPILVALILLLSLFHFLPSSNPIIVTFFLTATLAINTISDKWFIDVLAEDSGRRIGNFIFITMIGLSEILLLKPFLWWLLPQKQDQAVEGTGRSQPLISWLPVIGLVPALAALLLDTYSLADLHRTLDPDPAVRLFARGNFNGLALDQEQRLLYASGHGLNYLQVYHLDRLEEPPQVSPVENGYAQGFAYNSFDKEIYIYNNLSQQLLILDALTLELKGSIPTPQISPGDAWLVWDRLTHNILIASEADEQGGSPTIVLNRTSGEVLDTLNADPGSIILHPTEPLVYMVFFRRSEELLVYDTQLRQIIKRVSVKTGLERMAFATFGNDLELLVASPPDSAVLRFDAETLEPRGMIKTVFGIRTIAVDPARNLLLCGSLVTNMLEVIDLTTQQRLAEYYVGPWLRTINLDTEAGIAYVSSHEGLFAIQYADQLRNVK